MKVEEQYTDVLQNIEFGIVSTYRDHPQMSDYDVMRVLEALIDHYKAQRIGHTGRDFSLSTVEQACFDAVRQMCQWRLGDGVLGDDDGPLEEEFAGEPLTVDEMILCLKRLLKSVNRWNKNGGRKGYLNFIVKYVM